MCKLSLYTGQIADAVSALGIGPGDCLLVHASFRALGAPLLTPREVIDGLLAALPGGTLVFPALSYEHVGPSQRRFDVRATPSNVGALPEYFRTEVPGVRRSLCPTHSCTALGKNADDLLGDHNQDDTPCGPNSPYSRLRQLNGKILFLGCGCNCNTSMHGVEETVRPDYLFDQPISYCVIDEQSRVREQVCWSHRFAGVRQEYRRLIPLLEVHAAQGDCPPDTVRRGTVLQAQSVVVQAAPMWEIAGEYLRKDPYYFVDLTS